jgi:hypothetical protein
MFGRSDAFAQEDEPMLFYHPLEYGSASEYNPLSMVLNSGYGILQYPNRPRKIFDIDYSNGFRNVMANLGHPFSSISHYGWHQFVGDELIPMSLNKKNAQYWPNYQNHLIGGGMEFVMTTEYYRYHHAPVPGLLAFGTMSVYHIFNEVVENNDFSGDNVDPIADLLVFDPLGIVLFSIDGVPEFFAHSLRMNSWENQMAYDPWTKTIENHGINYSIKARLPSTDRWSFFYFWGMTGLVGLSYDAEDGNGFSAGAGLRAKELVPSGDQSGGRKLTADLTWNAGFFWDRNGSLLASLLVTGISDYTVQANVYPGVIRVAGFSPGVFFGAGEGGKFVGGLSVQGFPFGLAAGVSE